MLKYVTPQHYIEHVNAIGHLDKIIILSESEAKIIEGCLNQNIPGDICDFMGMFIPGINEIVAKELSSLINEKVNKKETAILLCPENMWQMMSSLKNNKPTLMEMVDKVFSHEIGHLAFYFYYSEQCIVDDVNEKTGIVTLSFTIVLISLDSSFSISLSSKISFFLSSILFSLT